jgi:hypothetical protein
VPALPGLPDHRLLAPGSDVLAAASAQLADGGPHSSFLAPLPGIGGDETHARITALTVPTDLQLFAATVVLVSPAGDLHGLSHRELQVLGLLVTGASNERIAGAPGSRRAPSRCTSTTCGRNSPPRPAPPPPRGPCGWGCSCPSR